MIYKKLVKIQWFALLLPKGTANNVVRLFFRTAFLF